ncbi:MAG TPA: hypothetical protein DIW46_03060, partial [Microbacterium sp.]|nr:hypothetical protein [Microbacterium sp.]
MSTLSRSRTQSAAHPFIRRLPAWVAIPAAIGVLLLVLPFVALLVRLDWAGVPAAITSPEALQAL